MKKDTILKMLLPALAICIAVVFLIVENHKDDTLVIRDSGYAYNDKLTKKLQQAMTINKIQHIQTARITRDFLGRQEFGTTNTVDTDNGASIASQKLNYMDTQRIWPYDIVIFNNKVFCKNGFENTVSYDAAEVFVLLNVGLAEEAIKNKNTWNNK